ncbi:hypothetical protein, partial [Rudanella paleaurantiibacter]|uniref:hypothetical protein n=1 Tax=Rudanella paleaurantiibacter TaxID=2614655 RepID=UPI001C88A001
NFRSQIFLNNLFFFTCCNTCGPCNLLIYSILQGYFGGFGGYFGGFGGGILEVLAGIFKLFGVLLKIYLLVLPPK